MTSKDDRKYAVKLLNEWVLDFRSAKSHPVEHRNSEIRKLEKLIVSMDFGGPKYDEGWTELYESLFDIPKEMPGDLKREYLWMRGYLEASVDEFKLFAEFHRKPYSLGSRNLDRAIQIMPMSEVISALRIHATRPEDISKIDIPDLSNFIFMD